MIIAFTLSMPSNNAWNGRWSGQDRCYAKVKARRSKPKFFELPSSHHYDFGDGWRARVDVKQIDADEARSLRKRSVGFCGYDWMIDDIEVYGHIRAMHERNR